MRISYALIACSTSALIAGCTPSPTYELVKIEKAADLNGGEIDSYCLQSSIIQIDKTGTKKDASGAEHDDLTASVILIDDLTASTGLESYKPFKIGMRRSDSYGVRSNINITKRQNSCIPSEIGTEVKDQRVELIGNIGSIVTTLASVMFSEAEGVQPDALPIRIRTLPQLEQFQGAAREGQIKFRTSSGVDVVVGPLPPDAKPRSTINSGVTVSGAVYSACRTAELSYKYKNSKYVHNVTVSDPGYYQFVAFPLKGKVSFHQECGVSVMSEKDTGVSTDLAVIQALATQGKAIRDALEAAQKDNKK